MERSIVTKPSAKPSRKYFRKQIVIPAEHGSWSWLLVPYFVGVLVAGEWNLPGLLVLVGGLSGFLVRQPATVWLRIRTGRGRKADLPLVAGWTLGFGGIALICLVGLIVLERSMLLWLLAPMAVVFGLYLLAARQRRTSTRTLAMEMAGAAGLAAMAPAAYIAITGSLDSTAWLLWGLMAAQNALGVLYVRLRIADTHGRQAARMATFGAHLLVLVVVSIAASLEAVNWVAVFPFVGFTIRAFWAVIQLRPVANIRRFGFSEIGFEIVGGLFIAASWLI